jgi:hypothetical protein
VTLDKYFFYRLGPDFGAAAIFEELSVFALGREGLAGGGVWVGRERDWQGHGGGRR